MLELILNKFFWLTAATGLGLLAVFAQTARLHGSGLPGNVRAAAGCNLFLGILFAILGTGHLVAVTTGAFLGTLSPDIKMSFLIPFGLALTLPGCLLLASVPGILAGQAGSCRTALAMNALLALVLLWNAPPVAVLPSLGFVLIFRIRRDWWIRLDERTMTEIRSAVSDALTGMFAGKDGKGGFAQRRKVAKDSK